MSLVVVETFTFYFAEVHLSGFRVVISACLHFALLTLTYAALNQMRNRSSRARRVVIVGTGRVARSLATQLLTNTGGNVQFEGFVDDRPKDKTATLGGVLDLERLAQSHFLDEVIVCLPDEPASARRAVFVARRLRVGVKVVPESYGCRPEKVMEMAGDIALLKLQESGRPELCNLAKRVLDVAVAGSALVALAPVLVAIGLLVKLDSVGPALYCARRAGRRGQSFLCYKFRTMHVHAEHEKAMLRENMNERVGPFFKLKRDPRVTRIGYWLRRYSLDELPQLWNILCGEMSLVGPRPHPLDDCEHYAPEHFQRLAVTPGLTGLWQVTARNDPSFERNMALDREYIQRQSLRMDLWILLRTLREVALGSGV